MIPLKYKPLVKVDNRHLSTRGTHTSESRVKVSNFFQPTFRDIKFHSTNLTCISRGRDNFVTLWGSGMSDAMQKPRHSMSTVLISGLARARAVNIPSTAASRRRMIMRVRRMGMVGTKRVHGGLNVRHLSRGEIRCPTAARGVPVQQRGKKKARSANCSHGMGRRRAGN